MKLLKNRRLMAGLGLILTGLLLICVFLLRAPSRELTRSELAELLQKGSLSTAVVVPTPYAGIYHIEATLKTNQRREKVFVTTHLDDAQIQKLFAQAGVRVEMPGAGVHGQWVNIISTITIAGLVIMLVVYQASIGKGRNSRV